MDIKPLRQAVVKPPSHSTRGRFLSQGAHGMRDWREELRESRGDQRNVDSEARCLISPLAFRLSPFAFRLSPFAFRLSPFASGFSPRTSRMKRRLLNSFLTAGSLSIRFRRVGSGRRRSGGVRIDFRPFGALPGRPASGVVAIHQDIPSLINGVCDDQEVHVFR